MKKNSSGSLGRDDELDRPHAGVVHAARGGDRRRAEALSGGVVDEGRRRLFDHLLVATLQGALALAQMHGRCRADRRAPALRCGGAARRNARGTTCRRRRRTGPPGGHRASASSRSSARVPRVAYPCHRRRPTASPAPGSRSLGREREVASRHPRSTRPGTTGTPEAATCASPGSCRPSDRWRAGDGPDEDHAGGGARAGEARRSRRGSRSRDARRRRRRTAQAASTRSMFR